MKNGFDLATISPHPPEFATSTSSKPTKALAVGMSEKAAEFKASGSELYVPGEN